MKKGRTLLVIVMAAVFVLSACGSSGEESGSSGEKASKPKPKPVTYSSIYKEYSKKINEAGDRAVESYKKKSDGESDITTLAELANGEVEKIAEVQLEGGEKMASLMTKNGDDYDVYDQQYQKLYKVYNKQGMRVYKTYISQYLDTIPMLSESMKKETMQQLSEQMEQQMEQMAPEEEQ